MTTAFDDPVLRRRRARRQRLARAKHVLGRLLVPIAWLIGTAVVVCAVVGFSEARDTFESRFDWPAAWLARALGRPGTRPVLPFSGAVLTLFVGGWLSYAAIRLLRRGLRLGYGPLAIARNVVEEAVRNKIVLLLLGLLLIALAYWPWSLLGQSNPQPLRYQIQGFLSFATTVSGLLLGAVTILFGAYSVGGDIQINRTGDVFVKPLGRVGYLVGKWLGVVLLTGTILAVQTAVIWGVARLWMGTNYVSDAEDLTTVSQRVLVAREAERPVPEVAFEDAARARFKTATEQDGDLVARRGRAQLFNDYLNEQRNAFLDVPAASSKIYLFDNLSGARAEAERVRERIGRDAPKIAEQFKAAGVADVRPEDLTLELFAGDPVLAARTGVDVQGAMLQFRFKIKGTNSYGSKTAAFHLKVNGRVVNNGEPIVAPIDLVQVYDLPATYVDDAGRLALEVINDVPDAKVAPPAPPAVADLAFDPDTWPTLYHIVGSFGANLVRGAVVQWVRLMFLAMLGVVTAGLLSYPVAAVLSLSVWVLAASGDWLNETLSYRVADTDVAAIDQTVNNAALPLVRFVASLFARYSHVDVGQRLVDGVYLGWGEVLLTTAWVLVVWTGAALLIGGYLFTRREIARVQV